MGHGVRTLEGWARRLKPRSQGSASSRGVASSQARASLPHLWLVTDPFRLPRPVASALSLPRGAGILARGAPPPVLKALAEVARTRQLTLLVGADGRRALARHAGLHLPDRALASGAGLLPFLLARRAGAPWARLTCAAHGMSGLARARRLGADAVFLSPAFPTASHPGAPALGPLRWAALARQAARPAIALGGLSAGNAGRLPRSCAGLAAIGNFAE